MILAQDSTDDGAQLEQKSNISNSYTTTTWVGSLMFPTEGKIVGYGYSTRKSMATLST